MTEVLEHLKKEDVTLKEIRRVLKNDGKLILSVPKKRWFNFFNPVSWLQHEREYSEGSIRKILEKNKFRINKIFVGGDFWELINLWMHLIFKHFLGKLHIDSFFPERINKTYKKNFKGRGFDIIIQAEKIKRKNILTLAKVNVSLR
jgi:SAM-dependent methyltransferase